MKKLLLALLLVVGFALPASAQFTITHVFEPGTPILSTEVNANFSLLADAVNRRGGTITGNISVSTNITIDGVDISDFLISTGEVRTTTGGTVGAPSFSFSGDTDTGLYFPAAGALGWVLNGTERMKLDANGLTVFGTNVLDSNGKVPGFTSIYFTSLDGSAITNVPEANIQDGSILARVAADETITGSWTHNIGTITSAEPIVSYVATWNDGGTTFTGLDIDVTNTASAADSKPFKVSVGGAEKFSVNASGVTSMTTFQMTTGATNGHVLTSDASGNASWAALPAGTAGVPAGLVAMFESSCPSGWTRRSGSGEPYENKFPRGGETYSEAGGGADTHNHAVDPASTASTAGGSHTHSVDIASTATDNQGQHGHGLSGSTGSTDINHQHSFTTGGPSGSFALDATGGSTIASNSHTHSGTTDSGGGSHSHSAGSLVTDSGGGHTHSADPAAVTSGDVSATHTHNVDIASFNSSTESNVPAYVQVVFCKKD